MAERPILFSGAMVRALLAGTKTQTRRMADKMVRHPDLGNLYKPGAMVLEREPQHVIERACPYGAPGDRLWVREAHAFSAVDPDGLDWHDDPDNWDVIYRADPNQPAGGWRDADGRVIAAPWRPSIHMPRWASRILLEITEVRVERLQDISDADAIAEGIENNSRLDPAGTCHWRDYSRPHAGFSCPVDSYRTLWNDINGDGSWDANPWVWALTFRRLP